MLDLRTAPPWKDLPEELGAWKTTYNRSSYWVKKGHLDKILEVLKNRDPEWHMIDGSIIRAHWHAAGARCARQPGT